jgi:type IV secretory pathway TrbF-like protein
MMDKDQFLMELYEEAYEIGISDEQMGKLKEIANEDDSFNRAMVAKILVKVNAR